jgi:hypothetical protein
LLKKAEQVKKPALSELFTDVCVAILVPRPLPSSPPRRYDTLPPHIEEQQQELLTHLQTYHEHYKAALEDFHQAAPKNSS